MKVKDSHSNQKIQHILKELNLSEKVELLQALSQEVNVIWKNDSLLEKLKKAPTLSEEEIDQFKEARNYVSKLTL